MQKLEYRVAIVAAILSFVGALAGVLLASQLEQHNWSTRALLEHKQALVEKRIATLERVVVILNKAPVMVGLQGSLQAEKDLARLALTCADLAQRRPGVNCAGVRGGDSRHVEELGREIHELGAEYAAAATLAATYFGPKTRDAIAELRKAQWWEADGRLTQNVVDAMGTEIMWFE